MASPTKTQSASERKPLTAERLREILHYDPETGLFTWCAHTTPRHRTTGGQIAGRRQSRGYIQITIDGRCYVAHRLAWFYITGSWPAAEIDHINGIRDDNRFVNLREATRAQNMANSRRLHSNTSGFKGVSFDKRDGRWRAYIRGNQRRHHLGSFDTPEEAHAAYCAAAAELFGEFARPA